MPADPSTVLIVEDEPLIRLFISDLLEDAGFKVVEAANATEALVLLEAGLSVNVLLTDVDMPMGCSGFELAHRVHRSWPETELLIMSGRQWPSQGDLPTGAAFLADISSAGIDLLSGGRDPAGTPRRPTEGWSMSFSGLVQGCR